MGNVIRNVISVDRVNAAAHIRISTRDSGVTSRSRACVPLAWEKAGSYNPATLPRRFFSGTNRWTHRSVWVRLSASALDVKTAGTEISGYKSLHFS